MKAIGRHRHLKNESGAVAILSVVIMSFVVVTTLTTVYIYLVNRAKYHSRIREAYQLTHVMEEFGKLTRQAYDTANSVTVTCPSGLAKNSAEVLATIGMPMCFPPCSSAQTDRAAKECASHPAVGNMCILHLGKDYCLESTPIVGDAGTASLDHKTNIAQLMIQGSKIAQSPHSFLNSWYARLDQFFESTVAQPIQTASHNHLLPSLNIKVPLPSAFKWIERETYALASGEITSNESSPKSTNTVVYEPVSGQGSVATDDGENLKTETCGSASGSLPTCNTVTQERHEEESGGVIIAAGTPKPVGGDREIPEICLKSPGSNGTSVLNLQCLDYCSQSPSLPGCTGVQSASITMPACPDASDPRERCQTCVVGECVELGYCLAGRDCSLGKHDNLFFKQAIRLIR